MKTIIAFISIAISVSACAAKQSSTSWEALEPSGSLTQYPIVLAHGFNAGREGIWGFNPEIVKALETDGHSVHLSAVPPFNSVEVRARELKKQIDEILRATDRSKVNIIAHSMGGLDARYLISRLGYSDKVASLTTISTPHHGTYIADVILEGTQLVSEDILNKIARVIAEGYTSEDLANNSELRAAFQDLSEKNAPEFNRRTPDDTGVYYQSWAGLSHVGGISNPTGRDRVECTADNGELLMREGERDRMDLRLIPIAWFVAHEKSFLPNDGVVTVASARWGDFHGCIAADHLDEIGQGKDKPHNSDGFDYLRFYRNLAFDLAQRGY